MKRLDRPGASSRSSTSAGGRSRRPPRAAPPPARWRPGRAAPERPVHRRLGARGRGRAAPAARSPAAPATVQIQPLHLLGDDVEQGQLLVQRVGRAGGAARRRSWRWRPGGCAPRAATVADSSPSAASRSRSTSSDCVLASFSSEWRSSWLSADTSSWARRRSPSAAASSRPEMLTAPRNRLEQEEAGAVVPRLGRGLRRRVAPARRRGRCPGRCARWRRWRGSRVAAVAPEASKRCGGPEHEGECQVEQRVEGPLRGDDAAEDGVGGQGEHDQEGSQLPAARAIPGLRAAQPGEQQRREQQHADGVAHPEHLPGVPVQLPGDDPEEHEEGDGEQGGEQRAEPRGQRHQPDDVTHPVQLHLGAREAAQQPGPEQPLEGAARGDHEGEQPGALLMLGQKAHRDGGERHRGPVPGGAHQQRVEDEPARQPDGRGLRRRNGNLPSQPRQSGEERCEERQARQRVPARQDELGVVHDVPPSHQATASPLGGSSCAPICEPCAIRLT